MECLLSLLITICLLIVRVDIIKGRGRMIEPPQRSSLWRFPEWRGAPMVATNTEDNGLNCGGYWKLHEINMHQCGVCGDAYDDKKRPNEAGGRYGLGIIVKTYTQDDQFINVTIDIKANIGGYFEFRICPNNDIKRVVQQSCLDKYPLVINGHGLRYYPYGDGIVNLKVKIPVDLTCEQCVLQWKWKGSYYWGVCGDGYGGMGCGDQEEYYNCADVAILPSKTLFNEVPATSLMEETYEYWPEVLTPEVTASTAPATPSTVSTTPATTSTVSTTPATTSTVSTTPSSTSTISTMPASTTTSTTSFTTPSTTTENMIPTPDWLWRLLSLINSEQKFTTPLPSPSTPSPATTRVPPPPTIAPGVPLILTAGLPSQRQTNLTIETHTQQISTSAPNTLISKGPHFSKLVSTRDALLRTTQYSTPSSTIYQSTDSSTVESRDGLSEKNVITNDAGTSKGTETVTQTKPITTISSGPTANIPYDISTAKIIFDSTPVPSKTPTQPAETITMENVSINASLRKTPGQDRPILMPTANLIREEFVQKETIVRPINMRSSQTLLNQTEAKKGNFTDILLSNTSSNYQNDSIFPSNLDITITTANLRNNDTDWNSSKRFENGSSYRHSKLIANDSGIVKGTKDVLMNLTNHQTHIVSSDDKGFEDKSNISTTLSSLSTKSNDLTPPTVSGKASNVDVYGNITDKASTTDIYRNTTVEMFSSSTTTDLVLSSNIKLESNDSGKIKLESNDSSNMKLESNDSSNMKLESNDSGNIKLESNDSSIVGNAVLSNRTTIPYIVSGEELKPLTGEESLYKTNRTSDPQSTTVSMTDGLTTQIPLQGSTTFVSTKDKSIPTPFNKLFLNDSDVESVTNSTDDLIVNSVSETAISNVSAISDFDNVTNITSDVHVTSTDQTSSSVPVESVSNLYSTEIPASVMNSLSPIDELALKGPLLMDDSSGLTDFLLLNTEQQSESPPIESGIISFSDDIYPVIESATMTQGDDDVMPSTQANTTLIPISKDGVTRREYSSTTEPKSESIVFSTDISHQRGLLNGVDVNDIRTPDVLSSTKIPMSTTKASASMGTERQVATRSNLENNYIDLGQSQGIGIPIFLDENAITSSTSSPQTAEELKNSKTNIQNNELKQNHFTDNRFLTNSLNVVSGLDFVETNLKIRGNRSVIETPGFNIRGQLGLGGDSVILTNFIDNSVLRSDIGDSTKNNIKEDSQNTLTDVQLGTSVHHQNKSATKYTEANQAFPEVKNDMNSKTSNNDKSVLFDVNGDTSTAQSSFRNPKKVESTERSSSVPLDKNNNTQGQGIDVTPTNNGVQTITISNFDHPTNMLQQSAINPNKNTLKSGQIIINTGKMALNDILSQTSNLPIKNNDVLINIPPSVPSKLSDRSNTFLNALSEDILSVSTDSPSAQAAPLVKEETLESQPLDRTVQWLN